MSATRKAIRKAIAQALTGNTAAGANVFTSRVRAMWADELPAILVYSREEEVTVFNASPRELRRVLKVGIEIIAKADESLDDVLDDIAQQVEAIISENQTPGGADDAVLSRAEVQIVKDGDNQHGACLLSYDVTYYTWDVASGTDTRFGNELVPFETAHTEYKVVPGADPQPATVDDISLPQ